MTVPGVTYHGRESWQDPRYPVFGPYDDPANNDTVVVHYTAADDLIDGDPGEHAEDLPAYLRNMQYSYVTQRGYSLGYSFAVDWLGGVWQIRGWEFQSAANRGHNGHTLPVLMLVDGADPATPEAVAAVRKIVAEAERRFGRELTVVGHRDIGATACPGEGLYRQVQAGVFYPNKESVVVPIKPTRLFDSRKFNNLKPEQPVWLSVDGIQAVPSGATGVFVTLTAVPGNHPGYITLWPHGDTRPPTSDVNFQPHINIANTTLVGLNQGKFSVVSSTWTDFIVDVKGYTM